MWSASDQFRVPTVDPTVEFLFLVYFQCIHPVRFDFPPSTFFEGDVEEVWGHKYSSKLDATVFLQVFGANHQDIPTHVVRAFCFITNKLQEPLIFSAQEQLISSVNAFAFNQAGYVVSTWPEVYRPWSTRRPLKIHQWDLREKSYFPPTSPSLHSQYLYPRIQILDFVKCLVDIKKSTVRYRQVHSVPFYRVVWLQGIFQYSAEHIPIL